MQTDTPDTLAAFLDHPAIGGMVAASPAIAAAAVAAREDRARLAEALAAAEQRAADAEARAASTPGSAPVLATGAAPIVRAPWRGEVAAIDGTYTAPDRMAAILTAALASPEPLPVLMIGPPGTGKTEAAAWAAARAGRPLYVVDAGPVRDACDWFGSPTLVGGRVAWQDSTLVAALATPGAVILIDELNRSATAAQSALLAILDRRGSIQFPQRPEPVRVAPGVAVIATANIGAQHVGTSTITPALRDRLVTVPCDYLDPTEEAALIRARVPSTPRAWADALAGLAATTRARAWIDAGGEAISTRAVLRTAALAAALRTAGADPAAALLALAAEQPDENYGQTQTPRASLAALAARTFPATATA